MSHASGWRPNCDGRGEGIALPFRCANAQSDRADMASDPARISDLYHAALERALEERSAFLAQACDGDDALRQEMESLLANDSAAAPIWKHRRSDDRGSLADAGVRTQMIGRELGPYTILAPLGTGGMGEVYRARDSKLGRDVAIKILPSHFTDGSRAPCAV